MPPAAILLLLAYTVTDGDTLRAGDVGGRSWGIDLLEMNEPAGHAAKAALAHLTNGAELHYEAKGIDRYTAGSWHAMNRQMIAI